MYNSILSVERGTQFDGESNRIHYHYYVLCLLHYYNYMMIKINKRYESHSLCKPLKG